VGAVLLSAHGFINGVLPLMAAQELSGQRPIIEDGAQQRRVDSGRAQSFVLAIERALDMKRQRSLHCGP
jgi:hypothetical protein